jgi:hypothetical protein
MIPGAGIIGGTTVTGIGGETGRVLVTSFSFDIDRCVEWDVKISFCELSDENRSAAAGAIRVLEESLVVEVAVCLSSEKTELETDDSNN